MLNLAQLLKKALQENQIAISDLAIQQFIHYLELLQTWNRVFNLTAIINPHDMVYLHLIDSLTVSPYLQGTRMLDVGSGAGLPGIPLAILHPKQQWVLLDKSNKKTRFMTQAIAELGLNNVQAVHQRCEDFHPSQCFDTILSRAFATLSLFVTATAHLLCADGIFIAMKGKHPEAEVAEIPDHFFVQKVISVDIKGIDVDRHMVVVKKMQR